MCQELVTLPGTLCLKLVNIVLIRPLLSENSSLSNLKMFVGGEVVSVNCLFVFLNTLSYRYEMTI